LVPSVLIVSEELDFLLNCYSSLRRDARIGRVEATTNPDEATRLVRSFHPHAVVVDSSAGGSFGLPIVNQLCQLDPNLVVLVTFTDRDRVVVEQSARSSGAAGTLSRDGFTVEAVLQSVRALPDDGA
jgi:DNA-binding NarL/FixJ family response regulator